MITIPRSLIRQLRTLFRRARVGKSDHSVVFRTASDGLRVRTMLNQVALEFHQPGEFEATEELVVPADLLAACEGRTAHVITLENRDDKIVASWTDRGIPQIVERAVETDSPTIEFPPAPESFEPNPPELFSALQAAITIAERERIRFALDYLQLRGDEGKIVATDGRQVLVQSGFRFPWSGGLLVPASNVLGCRELAGNESIGVARLEDWIVLRFGPWTVWLRIDPNGRFPKIDDLFRQPSAAASSLTIESMDAEFLDSSLMRLPCDDTRNQAVTLDLNGRIVVRGQPAGQSQATELILSRSTWQGEPVAISSNRAFLARALQLGFREVYFFGNQAPAQCDDGRRQYLWALLEPDSVIRSHDDATRIESVAWTPLDKSSIPKPTRRRLTVPQSIPDSKSAETPNKVHRAFARPAPVDVCTSSIGQAVALRTALREALTQTSQLIRLLKREKRQNRLVSSTLASLKQLQKVA